MEAVEYRVREVGRVAPVRGWDALIGRHYSESGAKIVKKRLEIRFSCSFIHGDTDGIRVEDPQVNPVLLCPRCKGVRRPLQTGNRNGIKECIFGQLESFCYKRSIQLARAEMNPLGYLPDAFRAMVHGI